MADFVTSARKDQENTDTRRRRRRRSPLSNQSEGQHQYYQTHYPTTTVSSASSHDRPNSPPPARFPPKTYGFDVEVDRAQRATTFENQYQSPQYATSAPVSRAQGGRAGDNPHVTTVDPRPQLDPRTTSSSPYHQRGEYTKKQLDIAKRDRYIPSMEDLDIEEEAINYWRKQEEKAGRANTKKRQRTDSTDLGSDNLPLKSEKPLPPDASTPQDSQANPFVLDTSPSPKPPPKRLAQGYDASTSGYDTHRFDDYAYQQPVTDASTRPDDIAEIEPTLCKEQADLVDLIMSGRNVFYTGSAGCGKSTVLKAFVKRLTAQGKTVQILAPTGRAALAINGTTTWSYLGWVPSHHKLKLEDLLRKADGKLTWKRLNATDVIVIDEISMVENLHFERMNIFLQKARGNRLPFGGVQMVVTGDFCQLPPVKPFQHCIHCGEDLIEHKREKEYECLVHGFYYDRDKWAFRSNAWKLCEFVHVNLKTIHRQSDKVFIDLLQKIRLGLKLSSADMDLLLNHETKGMNANAVKLFGSRAEVDRVNAERFRKLRSKPRSYMCLDDFRWNERHYNLRDKGQRAPNGALIELQEKEHRYSMCVELKQGMAVVLLANLNIKAGLVNGAQGVIQGFKPYLPEKMPKAGNQAGGRALVGEYAAYREEQIQEFIEQAEFKEWPEVRFNNGLCCVIQAYCTVNEYGDRDIKPYTLLSRTQIPLIAGYAITTHKSQGMTLDKVEVDLSRTFEPGQAYVALSRARSLEGLKVVSFPENAQMGADPQVREFLQTAFPSDFNTSDWES